MIAEFMVSDRVKSFVSKGQEITLRFDALPYQKYGEYKGTIEEISELAFEGGHGGGEEPMYELEVFFDKFIEHPDLENFEIESGMSVTAVVEVDERNFLKEIF